MFVVGGRAFNMKRVEMFIGESFCQALEFLDVFGIIHSVVAGMVLAIIRLLYVKYPHKLNKFRNGRFEVQGETRTECEENALKCLKYECLEILNPHTRSAHLKMLDVQFSIHSACLKPNIKSASLMTPGDQI